MAWAEITNDSWEPAFARAEFGLLLRFSGDCPRCGHPTMLDITRTIPSGPSTRGDEEIITMYCRCGYPHTGHPDGDNSCGAFWTIESEL